MVDYTCVSNDAKRSLKDIRGRGNRTKGHILTQFGNRTITSLALLSGYPLAFQLFGSPNASRSGKRIPQGDVARPERLFLENLRVQLPDARGGPIAPPSGKSDT